MDIYGSQTRVVITFAFLDYGYSGLCLGGVSVHILGM